MRLQVSIKVNEIKIEEERMQFVSLIKNALSVVDEEYFKSLYYFEGNKRNKKAKSFTFATYYRNYTIEEGIIKTNDDVRLIISTNDNRFAIKLIQGLTIKKNYEYKESKMLITSVNVIQEKKVNNNVAIFKTLSAFALNNANHRYIEINDDTFEDNLNYAMNILLKENCNRELKQRLKFTNLGMKKVVVKERVHDDLMYINAWKGNFMREGDKEDLNDIYVLGIGTRRSQGFGMIELIN